MIKKEEIHANEEVVIEAFKGLNVENLDKGFVEASKNDGFEIGQSNGQKKEEVEIEAFEGLNTENLDEGFVEASKKDGFEIGQSNGQKREVHVPQNLIEAAVNKIFENPYSKGGLLDRLQKAMAQTMPQNVQVSNDPIFEERTRLEYFYENPNPHYANNEMGQMYFGSQEPPFWNNKGYMPQNVQVSNDPIFEERNCMEYFYENPHPHYANNEMGERYFGSQEPPFWNNKGYIPQNVQVSNDPIFEERTCMEYLYENPHPHYANNEMGQRYFGSQKANYQPFQPFRQDVGSNHGCNLSHKI